MIRIQGHDYKVIYDRSIGPREGRGGCHYGADCEITINPDNADSQQREILIHELFEAIESTFNLQLDHNIIQTFGAAFHQIIADNPHVFVLSLPVGDER